MGESAHRRCSRRQALAVGDLRPSVEDRRVLPERAEWKQPARPAALGAGVVALSGNACSRKTKKQTLRSPYQPSASPIGRTSTVWVTSSNALSMRSIMSRSRRSTVPTRSSASGCRPPGSSAAASIAQMVEVLVPDKQLEHRDRVALPARDVAREAAEHRQRALAPAPVDRVGDVGAAADAGHLVDRRVRDEVADVRHDPFGARLDEEVVPQPVEVGAEQVDLLRDELQAAPPARRSARRRGSGRRRQQVEQRRHVAHSVTVRFDASSVASSAESRSIRCWTGPSTPVRRELRRVGERERVDVDAEHARRALGGDEHLAQAHRLAELAYGEGKVPQERRLHRGPHVIGRESASHRDQPHGYRSARAGRSCGRKRAVRVPPRVEIGLKLGELVGPEQRRPSATGNGDG